MDTVLQLDFLVALNRLKNGFWMCEAFKSTS